MSRFFTAATLLSYLYPVYTMKLARRALDEPARRASFIV